MPDVRAICAIGLRGQVGLDGGLPWEGQRGRAFVEDVERFFAVTRGHVLLAGPTTIASVPTFAAADRWFDPAWLVAGAAAVQALDLDTVARRTLDP